MATETAAKPKEYQAQSYDRLLGTPGFSDNLLKNHFTLYQGYVKNTNAVGAELADLLKQGKTGTPAYNELKRRFGWEFNGMRLHELYFSNMAKDAKPLGDGELKKKLEAEFGSLDAWRKDFTAVGAMRGIGWAVLAQDPEAGRLFNVWVNEHDVGHLAGSKTLLIMDVFEHAFTLDYGLKRADYIEAFLKSVDWGAVQKRLK